MEMIFKEGKVNTDMLMSSAMEVARGNKSPGLDQIHQQLLKAARQFALLVEPIEKQQVKFEDFSVTVRIDGYRILVNFISETNPFVTSGPPGQPLMWIIDSINAYPDRAMEMMRQAAIKWPAVK